MSNIRPLKIWKLDLDEGEELPIKESFFLPRCDEGSVTYLCGHSLGLQPVKSRIYLEEQMNNWQVMAVEGHFKGNTPWIQYTDSINEMMGSIVGAKEGEVVVMNSLTTNIHLLLAGFYKPRGRRTKIIVERPSFSSDIYAIRSHLEVRGYGSDHIIFWEARADSGLFELSDLQQLLEKYSADTALVFIPGLHYLNGQLLEIANMTELVHSFDIPIGFDLAHAAGNVELYLHDWGVDFACWCTYKYLNGGPGSIGGCFIHEKHHQMHHHFQGWWGNSMHNRFEMKPDFTPARGTEGWILSNPPILSLPSLKASLELFNQFGMQRLRSKSQLLTGYLEHSLQEISDDSFQILTPSDAERRGAMLCLQFTGKGEEVFAAISRNHLTVDYRRPDIIRVAPHPLYNSYADCFRFTQVLKEILKVE